MQSDSFYSPVRSAKESKALHSKTICFAEVAIKDRYQSYFFQIVLLETHQVQFSIDAEKLYLDKKKLKVVSFQFMFSLEIHILFERITLYLFIFLNTCQRL